MLKLPVLASDITNLTDARYFAAWYVDYMSFCMGQDSSSYMTPQQVKDIVGWVEGPEYLLQFKSSSTDTAYVEWMMESTDLTGAIAGNRVGSQIIAAAEPVIFLSEVTDIDLLPPAAAGYIITDSTIDWLSISKRSGKPVFLDYELSLEEISDLIGRAIAPGIVLRGGEEEKVGFKSYDDLDAIFELLMED